MRLIMAIVGGVIVGSLATCVSARAEDARAISVQGRAVVLPPVTSEYGRLIATLPTAPVVPPVTSSAVAAVSTVRPAVVAPPPGPPDGTPLMQRLEYFKSQAYRQWFEDLVRATAREHLSGASRPR